LELTVGETSKGLVPKVLVAPEPAPFAVEAVLRGGGALAKGADALDGVIWLGRPDGLEPVLASHPEVCWVQLPVAGIERVVETGVLTDPRFSGVTWTSAKGSYAKPVAEHALALALAGLRLLPERARATSWGERAGTSLYGGDVVILGGGGIAEELLLLLKPFGTNATVVRRDPRPLAGAAQVVTTSQLHEVLPGALVVFVALALVPETVHVIGDKELALMGGNSWLVNVARGGHVDTEALVDALGAGRIGGAALDVTEPEPLPDGHPLWRLGNCLITPHSADTDEMTQPLLAERIKDNVERLAAGGPLAGLVDPIAGY
jgi:phosphoglycerate dehydrogenase-like enzyme